MKIFAVCDTAIARTTGFYIHCIKQDKIQSNSSLYREEIAQTLGIEVGVYFDDYFTLCIQKYYTSESSICLCTGLYSRIESNESEL